MEPTDRAQIRTLMEASDFAAARALLDRLGLPEEDVEALALRAEVEAGLGNLDGAAKLYERVLAARPDNSAALYNASLVLSDLGRHDDAMTNLEALIEVEGETSAVLNDLAFEYEEAGHHVPSLLAAMRAESLANDEAQRCLARLNAATALANMGRRADGRARLDAMLRECTGACGEREAAEALRRELDPRHPRRTLTG